MNTNVDMWWLEWTLIKRNLLALVSISLSCCTTVQVMIIFMYARLN